MMLVAARSAEQVRALEGPIAKAFGLPFSSSTVDLMSAKFGEQEFFVTGEARRWEAVADSQASQDGRWTATLGGPSQGYKTRLLVRAPEPKRFNGTILVEWLQEMFGTERDVFFRWNAETILREGFAWVGVSLHHEGVDGAVGASLVRSKPERYGSLQIPDSALSYDILSQVARLLLAQDSRESWPHLMPGLKCKRLVAVGNSLAAWRLSTYINAVQPIDRLFDGFYLQDFRQKTAQDREDSTFPHDRWVRTDTAVPVMLLNTTPAAIRSFGQAPGQMLRRWEPAGAAHTNTFLMARTALAENRDTGEIIDYCPEDYANNIPTQYFSGAALMALQRWVGECLAPPEFPPIRLAGGANQGEPELDQNGNVIGGMRHPWIDIPIARYGWEGECVGGSGRTYPFSAEQLSRLYGSPEEYLRRFSTAVRQAVKSGVLLQSDAQAALSKAQRVTWKSIQS